VPDLELSDARAQRTELELFDVAARGPSWSCPAWRATGPSWSCPTGHRAELELSDARAPARTGAVRRGAPAGRAKSPFR
jgi:hypothetical protein